MTRSFRLRAKKSPSLLEGFYLQRLVLFMEIGGIAFQPRLPVASSRTVRSLTAAPAAFSAHLRRAPSLRFRLQAKKSPLSDRRPFLVSINCIMEIGGIAFQPRPPVASSRTVRSLTAAPAAFSAHLRRAPSLRFRLQAKKSPLSDRRPFLVSINCIMEIGGIEPLTL